MTMDLGKNYEKYRGLWVALNGEQETVVSSGKTVREAVAEAKKKGFDDPVLFRVPTEVVPYIGVAGDEV